MEVSHPKRILLLSPTDDVSTKTILSILTQPPTSTTKSKRPALASAPASTTPPPPPPAPSSPNPNPANRLPTQGQAALEPDTESQPLHVISNAYYTARIPVWSDAVGDPAEWARQWTAEDGAADVVRAVGAWLVCFRKPGTGGEKTSLTTLLTSISSVISHHQQSSSSDPYSYTSYDSSDAILIALAVPNPTVQNAPLPASSTQPTSNSESELELDDLCRAAGNWEYIDGTLPYQPRPASASENRARGAGIDDLEFKETEGIERLLEALEGGEWDADDGGDDGDGDGLDELDEELKEEDLRGDVWTGDERDLAVGFGELLAAGRASRMGLLERGVGSDTEANDGFHHDVDLDDDEDETWRIRGTGSHSDDTRRADGDGDGDFGAFQDAPPEPENRRDRGGDSGLADWATDEDVRGLQHMMVRLQAAKDLGADLPAAERRRLAREAVREVMRGV